MSNPSIMSLLQRRENLLQQLKEVNTQIICTTLDTGGADAPIVLPAGARGASHAGVAGKTGGRRKWFERGEMLKLTRKALTQPMSQADLVRALAAAKGYDKSLPSSERARFKSAAYQAIAAALEGKQLLRNKSGQVTLARR